MADADEFQNVLGHVAQILQSGLLSRIQIMFIVMYVRPNPNMKCGICTLFSVQFITKTMILISFLCGLHMGDSLHSVSCQFLELRCCLSHRDAKIVMSPGIDFLVQKYAALGHIKSIIQTTQVRDDRMWHVQEFLVFTVFWCYCNYV